METQIRVIRYPLALLVFATLCAACSKLPKPAFSFDPMDNPEAGENIQFTNETGNAGSYEWDFGDGGYSDLINPVHTYEFAGIYTVKLLAVNDAGEESVSEPVTIYEPTVLQFTVYDSTGEQQLVEALVELFVSENDLIDQKNKVNSALTDENGVVRFRNMEAEVYFVRTRKETEGGAWYFESSTPALEQNMENLFFFRCIWFPVNAEENSLNSKP